MKTLLEKGMQQNNRLCFADITDMIAGLENFTPKDYEKVMAAVTKAHIELVDKLAQEDLQRAKPKATEKPATKKVSASAELADEPVAKMAPV
ncbi:MAG: hypothetical protein ACI3WS_06620, partial [Phascolarctobacterium sp.]